MRNRDARFVLVLDSLSAAAEREPFVRQVVSTRSVAESTFESADHHTTFLLAALARQRPGELKDFIPELRAGLQAALHRLPAADGFEVKVTGSPALDHDVRAISAEDTASGERQVLPLTLIVLVLAFGALVAATLPIMVGLLAITIALGLLTELAHIWTMSVFVLNITTMVGLGVGIDYSLLIVTRFREELNKAPED